MDILIESVDLKFVLVIENKVEASEGTDQLAPYRAWMQSVYPSDWKRGLVFLTPDGRSPTTCDPAEVCCLSYSTHVTAWLGVNLDAVPPRLEYLLAQYLEVVSEMGSPDKPAIDDPIIKVLLRQEHLPAVFDVGPRFDLLQAEILKRFWSVLEKRLVECLPPSKLDGWTLGRENGWPTDHGAMLTLRPQPRPEAPHLYLFIQQYKDSNDQSVFCVWWGAALEGGAEAGRRYSHTKEIIALRQALTSKAGTEPRSDKDTLVGFYEPYRLKTLDTSRRILAGDELQIALAKAFAELFEKRREEMDEANRALARLRLERP